MRLLNESSYKLVFILITWVLFLFFMLIVESVENKKDDHNLQPLNLSVPYHGSDSIPLLNNEYTYYQYENNQSNPDFSVLVEDPTIDKSTFLDPLIIPNEALQDKQEFHNLKQILKKTVPDETLVSSESQSDILSSDINSFKRTYEEDYFSNNSSDESRLVIDEDKAEHEKKKKKKKRVHHVISSEKEELPEDIKNSEYSTIKTLLLRDRIKEVSNLKGQIILNQLIYKENPMIPLDEIPSSSGLQAQTISKVKEDKKQMHSEEKMNDTNQSTGKSVEEKTNKVCSDLLFIKEGYIFHRVYFSQFQLLAHKILIINKIIKDTDIDINANTMHMLKTLKNNFTKDMDHMDTCLTNVKKYIPDMPMINLINLMEKCDESIIKPVSKNDGIMFLDSVISMQLYLYLLSTFSISHFKNIKKKRKHFAECKGNKLHHCPRKGSELSRNKSVLSKMFQGLIIHICNKSKLHCLRGYYAATYMINNVFDTNNEGGLINPLPNFVDVLIDQVLYKYNLLYVQVQYEKFIIVNDILRKCQDNTFIKNEENVKMFIDKINEKQKVIEKKIKESLNTDRILNLYILHHFTYLMLQRCFSVRTRESEVQKTLNIYKSFICFGNSLISDSHVSLGTYNLHEKEQSLIYHNEGPLHLIFEYLMLNIIKIVVTEANRTFTQYIKLIRDKYIKKLLFIVDKKDFLNETKFCRNSLNILTELSKTLKNFNRYRYLLIAYLKIYALGDEINNYISNVYALLKISRGSHTCPEVQSAIAKIYDTLYFLIDKYTEFSKENIQ